MKKWLKLSTLVVVAFLLVVIIFFGASHISEQDVLKTTIEEFGVLGIFLISLITNLNILIPLHGASFSPVFIAAGFGVPTIIIALAIGTTCADLIGYTLGYFGKYSVQDKFPEVYAKIDYFLQNKNKYILPGIFIYSAFVPFPNELVMLPLGLMGYRLRKILIPLLLGTAVNTTIFTLGFSSVFKIIFNS